MRIFALPLLILTLSACSPTLNWRSVAVAGTPLTVLLPCKPDQAVREVDWGAGQVPLTMLGCEAGGATYAVSHLLLASPADAPVVLERWQQALQKQLQLASAPSAGEAFLIKNGLELPQARHASWQGRDGRGGAVFADVRWFVRLEGSGARVYQAMVLSPGNPVAADALANFAEGLQLR
ncbi:MAG: hypothetical protein RSD57_16330 [Comamonas sp.]